MKKITIITLFFALLLSLYTHAQDANNMVIEMPDGKNIAVKKNEVRNIFFLDNGLFFGDADIENLMTGIANKEEANQIISQINNSLEAISKMLNDLVAECGMRMENMANMIESQESRIAALEENFDESVSICPDDNHPHKIDLGLPSGKKWSCCNVNAEAPEYYGGFYAWGETEVKPYYSKSNYIHRHTVFNQQTLKYEETWLTYSDIGGTYYYDVATRNWGDTWCLPNFSDFDEIKKNCTRKECEYNDVWGYTFTGPNGNSIFFPNTAIVQDKRLNGEHQHCIYLTSLRYDENGKIRCYDLSKTDYIISYCYYGYSARPISEE